MGVPFLFPPGYIEDILDCISKGARCSGRNVRHRSCRLYLAPDLRRCRALVSYYGPRLAPEIIARIGLTPEGFDQIMITPSRRDYVKAQSFITDEMARIAIYGTPDDCVERIKKLIDKDLRHIRFGPPLGRNLEEETKREIESPSAQESLN